MKKIIDIDFVEGDGLDKIEIKGKVTLKRLNFSESNSIEEDATDIKMIGNVPQVKISTKKIKELGIERGVIENTLTITTYSEDKVTKNPVPHTEPYPLNATGVQGLPKEIGDELVTAFTELNSVNEKKK